MQKLKKIFSGLTAAAMMFSCMAQLDCSDHGILERFNVYAAEDDNKEHCVYIDKDMMRAFIQDTANFTQRYLGNSDYRYQECTLGFSDKPYEGDLEKYISDNSLPYAFLNPEHTIVVLEAEHTRTAYIYKSPFVIFPVNEGDVITLTGDISGLFKDTRPFFTDISLSKVRMKNVTNVSELFYNGGISYFPLAWFNDTLDTITDMSRMFMNSYLTFYEDSNAKINAYDNVEDMSEMFKDSSLIHVRMYKAIPKTTKVDEMFAGLCDTLLYAKFINNDGVALEGPDIAAFKNFDRDGKRTPLCMCAKQEYIDNLGKYIKLEGHRYWQGTILPSYCHEVVVKEPTKTEHGIGGYQCSQCGEIRDKYEIHNYSSKYTVDKEPTATQAGKESRYCTVCDAKTDTRCIHVYEQEYTVDLEPNCKKSGRESRHCTGCESTTDVRILDPVPTAHDWGNFVIDKQATCAEPGEMSQYCSICNARTNIKEIPIDPDNHNYSSQYTIDKAVSDTEDGSESKHCLNGCGSVTDVRVIHNFSSKFTIDKDSDCVSDGSMSRHCTNCSEVTDIKVIPKDANKHTLETEYTVKTEPTCIDDGVKFRYCAVCHQKFDFQTIPANGTNHIPAEEFTVDLEPTCMKEGSKSKHCTLCDAKTNIEAIPVNPDNHNFSEDLTTDQPLSCTDDWILSHHCLNEGCTVVDGQFVAEKAHHTYPDNGEYKTIKQASCSQDGLEQRTCEVCGHVDEIIIPKKPHTYSALGTCMYCKECKSVIENGEHNYVNGVCESCHTCFAVHKTGTHQFLNGKCECCNECESLILNKKHDFVNGKCKYCGEIETDEDGKPINQPEIIYQGECGDNATYEICKNEDGYTLYIKGYGDTEDYGDYDEQPWYLSKMKGDFSNSIITKVEIEDGITRIGDYLLSCSNITEITIPDSVKSIGESAFDSCSKLTSITLPNSLASIDAWAFVCCSSLTSVSIPCSVTEIGDNVFYDCSKSLEIHTVPESKASELIDGYGYKNITDLTHKYNGGICTSCGEIKNHLDAFTAASLTLTDGVIINFKTILEEDAVNDKDAYIHFTSEYGIDTKVMLSEGKPDGDSYIFSLYLRPDQMADEITATIVYGDETEGSSVKYSVIKYAENMKGKVEPKMAKLINAMLNYGAATQKYTNYNTSNLADFRVFEYFSPNVSIPDDYKMNLSKDNGSGAKVKSAYLSIEANITLKVKYEITGNISDYKFTCNGDTLSPYKDGDYYWVDIKNITPQDFDEMYDIVVTNKTNGLSRTIKYSALTYAKSVIENKSTQTGLVDLMKAMYYYNQAANAYVG